MNKWLYIILVVLIVGLPTALCAHVATVSGRSPFFTYGFVVGWTALCGSFALKLAVWLVGKFRKVRI
tara:strand:- start:192 stop:392 length:201 start_codon:yes stop_codon:yes gene_type:complete